MIARRIGKQSISQNVCGLLTQLKGLRDSLVTYRELKVLHRDLTDIPTCALQTSLHVQIDNVYPVNEATDRHFAAEYCIFHSLLN